MQQNWVIIKYPDSNASKNTCGVVIRQFDWSMSCAHCSFDQLSTSVHPIRQVALGPGQCCATHQYCLAVGTVVVRMTAFARFERALGKAHTHHGCQFHVGTVAEVHVPSE